MTSQHILAVASWSLYVVSVSSSGPWLLVCLRFVCLLFGLCLLFTHEDTFCWVFVEQKLLCFLHLQFVCACNILLCLLCHFKKFIYNSRNIMEKFPHDLIKRLECYICNIDSASSRLFHPVCLLDNCMSVIYEIEMLIFRCVPWIHDFHKATQLNRTRKWHQISRQVVVWSLDLIIHSRAILADDNWQQNPGSLGSESLHW